MTGRPGNATSPILHRLIRGPHTSAADGDPLARTAELASLEATLMLATEPVTLMTLARVLSISEMRVSSLLDQLRTLYDLDQTAFELVAIAGGYQLLTRPHYHVWLTRYRRAAGQEPRLTPTLLETLAIVAYKQPLTRADIESIRGVGAGDALRTLIERGYIKLAGRQNTLGRPQLYATTRRFLQLFGLNSLHDLPKSESDVPAVNTVPPPLPAKKSPGDAAEVTKPEVAMT